MAGTKPTSPTDSRFRFIGLAWLAIFVPFVITVIVGGPASGRLISHGSYHIIYIAVIVAAIVVLWKWRALSSSITVSRLVIGLLVLQGLAAVGHVGEWVSTFGDASYLDGATVVKGDESLHSAFANVSVPALVLSIIGLIALTVVAWRQTPIEPKVDLT